VRLWDKDGLLLARETDWPQPLKHYVFDKRGCVLEWDGMREEMRVSVERPVKGLVFAELEGVAWSDNCLDVMPGDVQVVRVEGLRGKVLSVTWYGISRADCKDLILDVGEVVC
jgi:beta-mannosidase